MRMFHLSKRTTTETMWELVICQAMDTRKDVKNIDTTVVTDWAACC